MGDLHKEGTMSRRVQDTLMGDYGTVTDEHPDGQHFHVAWDRPTPNQASAWVPVPSRHFRWATEQDG